MQREELEERVELPEEVEHLDLDPELEERLEERLEQRLEEVAERQEGPKHLDHRNHEQLHRVLPDAAPVFCPVYRSIHNSDLDMLLEFPGRCRYLFASAADIQACYIGKA